MTIKKMYFRILAATDAMLLLVQFSIQIASLHLYMEGWVSKMVS